MADILVIKLGALGDFVQALGPMRSIRAAHPQDRITLLTTKPFVPLASASAYADDIWVDARPKWYRPKEWLALRNRLNGRKFARVYDLQNNDRTSLYFRLFKPRPEWVGIAKGASHRNTSPLRTAGRAFDGHQQTLDLAGIRDIALDDLRWLRSDISRFALIKPYVLIIPGSSPRHPYKRWPKKNYARLCGLLDARGFQPVLIGTKGEREIADFIANSCPKALNLTGMTTLFDLPALAREAYGAIGNDTGPMHMIAPTGCRTIILFSKHSNPMRHAPIGPAVFHLRRNSLKDLPVEAVMEAFEN